MRHPLDMPNVTSPLRLISFFGSPAYLPSVVGLSFGREVHLHLSWILDAVYMLHVGLSLPSLTLYADPRLSLHKYLRNSLYPATVIGHCAF